MPGPEFSYPLRPWASFYNAAGFLAPKYHQERGKWHRGCDYNLVTGGDSDLGYPVSNCLPGTVVFAQKIVGSWGGIVVVRADEWVKEMAMEAFERPIDALELQYAHLRHVTVSEGQPVNAGDCVGSMGKGTFEQYTAHTHFECRVVHFDAGMAQGGAQEDYEFAQSRCLDPEQLFKRLPFSDHPNTLAQRPYWAPSRVLSVENPRETNAVVHPLNGKLFIKGVRSART